ncbi:MAG: hypothetical protein ABII26_11545, partial [Pseudomonadota bacterium]
SGENTIKKILSALRGSSEAGGKNYFLKGTFKKWNLNFSSQMASIEIRHLRSKKNELISILDSNERGYKITEQFYIYPNPG